MNAGERHALEHLVHFLLSCSAVVVKLFWQRTPCNGTVVATCVWPCCAARAQGSSAGARNLCARHAARLCLAHLDSRCQWTHVLINQVVEFPCCSSHRARLFFRVSPLIVVQCATCTSCQAGQALLQMLAPWLWSFVFL